MVSRLGGLSNLKLSVTGLPANVVVRMNGVTENNQNNAASIGLNIFRLNLTRSADVQGTFTRTNPDNNRSYVFTVPVTSQCP